jgi:hypothetical protein
MEHLVGVPYFTLPIKDVVFPMLTSVLCYEGVWEIGDITSHILTSVLLEGE